MRYILGINSAYHESSACLLKDGVIVGAVEEERLSRVKHAKKASVDNPDELPLRAIRSCLDRAHIEAGQVDAIGFSINPHRRLKNKDFDDLVIENISLVNNYRSQFDRVIARSSFEDLVRIIKAKKS